MKLNIRMLNESSTVNGLLYINSKSFAPGDTPTIMFQLVDTDLRIPGQPAPRYMPAAVATVSLFIQSINTANNLTLTCTQPFPQDASIWQTSLTASQSAIVGTTGVTVTLTEGSSIKSANVSQAIIVDPQSMYGC